MSPEEFRQIRIALGWSITQTGEALGLSDPKQARRFEIPEDHRNHRPVSGPVSILMYNFLAGARPDRHHRIETAARKLLDAFGGDVPDWLRPEYGALEAAVYAEAG